MSVNTSTCFNHPYFHPQLSDISSFFPLEVHCFNVKPGCLFFTTLIIINILLLLPLCTLILHRGLQQWRKQQFASASTMTTHSDSFTYHLVIMELSHVVGCVLCIIGIYMDYILVLIVWSDLYTIAFYGETFFHVLICVEHYLAVVHPVTYLSLKNERWIRIRNIITGCIWLLSFGFTGLMMRGNYLTVDLCLSISSVIIISFCSLSVLYALIHPGPGDQGKDRLRVQQSKQRAFYTIVAILGVLMLRCIFLLTGTVLSLLNGWINICVLTLSTAWINIPGSLVLPLLYLHRTEKSCLKNNRK